MKFIDHHTLSQKKSPGPKQDDMTGGNGASHSVPPHASTKLSAAPGRAAGRSMKTGKELASAGGSSADTAGTSPTQRKNVKGRERETEGRERKKMKKAVENPFGEGYRCNVCWVRFPTKQAACGHMRIYKDTPPKEVELSIEAVRKKVHMMLDLNKEPPKDVKNGGDECQPKQQVQGVPNIGQVKLNPTEGSETKCDGGTLAEGSASSLMMEARRKEIHMKFDLNKEPPKDVENDDEDYDGKNNGASARSTWTCSPEVHSPLLLGPVLQL